MMMRELRSVLSNLYRSHLFVVGVQLLILNLSPLYFSIWNTFGKCNAYSPARFENITTPPT